MHCALCTIAFNSLLAPSEKRLNGERNKRELLAFYVSQQIRKMRICGSEWMNELVVEKREFSNDFNLQRLVSCCCCSASKNKSVKANSFVTSDDVT